MNDSFNREESLAQSSTQRSVYIYINAIAFLCDKVVTEMGQLSQSMDELSLNVEIHYLREQLRERFESTVQRTETLELSNPSLIKLVPQYCDTLNEELAIMRRELNGHLDIRFDIVFKES